MVRLATVLRAITVALIAASMLVAPSAVAQARPCHQSHVSSNDGSLADRYNPSVGTPCDKGHCHGDPDDCACCFGSCDNFSTFIDDLALAIAPKLATIFAMAPDQIAAGRSIPPSLGPPRS
jgi:hypothetical protein